MRIREAIETQSPTLSFEFFPPKDDIGFWDLYRTVEALKPLDPTFVSVTYGTGGSTRRKTIELVGRIQAHIGIETAAHLTCVSSTRRELAANLDKLKQQGVENLLALRGDPPQGQTVFPRTEGGFQYANELVAFIRDRHHDGFCIGAACYPEGHPECPRLDRDLDNLKRKVDAGVDFLITQLFFDNDCFFAFRDRAVAAGIGVPIIVGLMPILSVRQIKRFTEMCGATIPPPLLEKIESVEDDSEAVRHIGMYHATGQCHALIEQQVAGVHFYTLNRSTATRAIFQEIKAELPVRQQRRVRSPL